MDQFRARCRRPARWLFSVVAVAACTFSLLATTVPEGVGASRSCSAWRSLSQHFKVSTKTCASVVRMAGGEDQITSYQVVRNRGSHRSQMHFLVQLAQGDTRHDSHPVQSQVHTGKPYPRIPAHTTRTYRYAVDEITVRPYLWVYTEYLLYVHGTFKDALIQRSPALHG